MDLNGITKGTYIYTLGLDLAPVNTPVLPSEYNFVLGKYERRHFQKETWGV